MSRTVCRKTEETSPRWLVPEAETDRREKGFDSAQVPGAQRRRCTWILVNHIPGRPGGRGSAVDREADLNGDRVHHQVATDAAGGVYPRDESRDSHGGGKAMGRQGRATGRQGRDRGV